ncbi:MAG TPA: HypC/HybG/HupF family hydrogenase formation chaperone [Gemmatimonadales bacterium]|nr:HypC/HybG/HupF family hydrogenase formation chaperone [Gemmatimonadales bacterium]
MIQHACAICSDYAVLGKVVALDGASCTADVALECGITRVATDLLEQLAVGDIVLVHQGFAIAQPAAARER